MVATYLVLTKMMGDREGSGAEEMKDAIKDGAPGSRKLMEKYGGKLVEAYLTMGAYDGAAIVEFPNDEACARAMLAWRQFGLATETLRAWPEREWGKLAEGL